VLALVAHAMIPVALEEGGSLVVLPTVAGFLFALYLALTEAFVETSQTARRSDERQQCRPVHHAGPHSDTAADNLRVAKILIQLGLDPNNITYDAIFNRLLEIVLANITLANMFALVGAIFFVATLLTQTMVPLRVANMIGCTFFVGFGALAGDVKTFSVSPVAPHQRHSPSSKCSIS